jgi:hypothetical protein
MTESEKYEEMFRESKATAHENWERFTRAMGHDPLRAERQLAERVGQVTIETPIHGATEVARTGVKTLLDPSASPLELIIKPAEAVEWCDQNGDQRMT